MIRFARSAVVPGTGSASATAAANPDCTSGFQAANHDGAVPTARHAGLGSWSSWPWSSSRGLSPLPSARAPAPRRHRPRPGPTAALEVVDTALQRVHEAVTAGMVPAVTFAPVTGS
jgi:hypothetical protein